MVSREMIEIILKAEDQASSVVKQNEQNVKRFGDAAQQANQKAGQASMNTQQKLEQLNQKLSRVSSLTSSVADKGASQFQRYDESIQDSITKFNMLDKETQEWLNRLSNAHNPQVFYELNSQAQQAVSKFNALDNATDTWQGSLEYSRSKLQLLGTNTDSLKGKIQVVGNGIQTYIGNKWDGIKSKVSNFGGFIKTNLSNALSAVRSKLDSLGSAFSGLGGVISSVVGGIGIKELGDMTIGASISRDRIFNLSYAILGAGQSMDDFKNKSDSLWNQMDADTNTSLVGLDQISQAMSVINMSANASEGQLKALEPVVLDIGQRAILMGKDGEEAVGLMQAAGKGLNGEFEMLRENLGITKDKLEAAGWTGSADDIDGYTKALSECLSQSGDVSDMMNTTSGKLTRLQKYWGLAGRSLGDQFLPYVDQALTSLVNFFDADDDGALDARGKQWMQYGYAVMAVGSSFATFAPSIAPALTVLDNLGGKTKSALQFLGLMEAEEGALTLATLRESAAQKVSAATKYLAGVATATYGAIVGVLTGEIGLVTAAQQVWNAVMAANPIMLVVIALAALAVAIYEAGKMFGWWSDVGSMIDAIKNNVTRLWDAFINNPNVQGLIHGIGDAWNWLLDAAKPVIDWLSGIWDSIFPPSATGQWDVTRTIIEGVGMAFNFLTIPIKLVISALQLLYPYMQMLYSNVLVPLGSFLASVFAPVWQLLQSIMIQIAPMIMTVINAFNLFASGQMPLPDLIRTVMTNLWNIYNTVLTSIGRAVINWARTIVTRGINAASKFVSGIILRIVTLPGRINAYLLRILNSIILIGTQWVATARNRAFALVSGVIGFISSLPSRIAGYLWSVVSRIVSAGASWVSNATSIASNVVSGVMNQITSLPGRVYNEFMNIGGRIMQAGSDLVNKAANIGKNIVDGMMNAMGIHSPGTIQTNVVNEFVNMISNVGNKVKSAYDTAKNLGSAIVDGFGNPSLETDVSNLLPNEDAIKTSVGVKAELAHPIPEAPSTPSIPQVTAPTMDTTGVDSSNTEVIGSFNNMAVQTGTALQNMVNKDKMAYDAIQKNDSTTLSTITTNLKSNLNRMSNNVKTDLNKMTSKNKTSLQTMRNTTSNNLKNMVSKTKTSLNTMSKSTHSNMNNMVQKTKNSLQSAKSATNIQLNNMIKKTQSANSSMIKSWGHMKDGIVDAASRIKSDSTEHFNKLESTIGSFYRKLQNPSGFGAGPGMGTVSTTKPLRRASSSGISKITNAMRKAQLPSYLSFWQMKHNPLVNMENVGSYITPHHNNRFSVSDLIRSGNIRIPIGLEDKSNGGAGSWTDSVPKHVQKIKDTSKNWAMKGPKIIGKYATSTGFKVSDFINGTPKIDFNTFKQMAEDVFSQCHYEFYYDSAKYGNWMTAFQHGGMNCSDSSDALIAMAHACGLSAGKVHGHWNQYGHYWATVEGHKMDTTGWMNRRNWTPAASHAGPAPKSWSFEDLFGELKTLFTNNDDQQEVLTTQNEVPTEITIKGELTHDFKNLPDGVTAEEVAKFINEIPEDQNWIKKLVKNVIFQKLDIIEKQRIQGRNKRAKGAY